MAQAAEARFSDGRSRPVGLMILKRAPNRAAPGSRTADVLPHLSVIVPCRNEEKFIAQCLESILRNDYPKDRLEILVVDGMSVDATLSIARRYAGQHCCIKVLRNRKEITPAGLNLGIKASVGDVVCRVDAHARVASDYLRRCVERLCNGDADNVGGAMRTLPYDSSLWARSIALCMSHKFGAGNSVFRTGTGHPAFTDTVFGGCYRKETFARIGLFNETLPRTQDIEFNQRLRKSGGRILIDPAIKCDYFASASLRSFAKHNFDDGMWSILPFARSEIVPVRPRHLIPFVFVTMMIAFAVLGFRLPAARLALIMELVAYASASIAFSLQLSRRHSNASFLFTMPLIFAIRHFAYGVGSLCASALLFTNWPFLWSLLRLAALGRSKLTPSRTQAQ